MKQSVLTFTIMVPTMLGVSVEDELIAQPVSPEVHADQRVTFRLRAPEANEVHVKDIAELDPQAMTKNSDGVWEVTVGPLAPELYSYLFEVDGTTLPDPHNRNVKKWLSNASLVEVPGDPPLLHERQEGPHGVFHYHIYGSTTTQTERGVFVYTPPGYTSDSSKRYPLVLLLHGYGDDESAWLEVGRAHCIADNLLAKGKIDPMIIAMPYGHPLPVKPGRSFDNYTAKNIVAMERDLLQDLLPYLSKEYHLRDGREQRAIVGLSMGGGQSLGIGLEHIDEFAWIGGFSSATPRGDLDKQFADLIDDVAETNRQLKLLWIGCGKDDFLIQRNESFTRWLAEKKIRHTWRPTEGSHNWMVWRKYLAEFLPQLFG